MPTPYKHTMESHTFVADIEVTKTGIPVVDIRDKDARDSQIEVTYTPTHIDAQPTITIRDATYMTLETARNISEKLPDAIKIASDVVDEVTSTFALPTVDPAGNVDDRARAIANLLADGHQPTSEEIDAAIASCYQTEDTTATELAMRAIRNMFADDKGVRLALDAARQNASIYREARNREQELAHAPKDEYDQIQHKMANDARISAHNTFIRSMTVLAEIANRHGMDNVIADITKMPNPYVQPNRETIARMAYEMN